jgi:arylsulfatase A-like enzyme
MIFSPPSLMSLISLAGILAFAWPGSMAQAKPNVIIFLVDDMGWMDCGVYGSQYYETPHIDALAKRAMRFTNAYACPLCSPTRASILTGQYSARHGITSATGHLPPQAPNHAFLPPRAAANQRLRLPESRNYLEPSHYTLAEALQDAGYRTAHIGKWHLGLTRPYWPETQGFALAFHCHPDPGPPGNYFSPYGVQARGEAKGGQRVGTITDGPAGEYITDRLTDEALRFIEEKSDQPFFLNLWQYGVHGPWGHKENYTAAFAHRKDPTGRQGNPIMGSMLKSIDESLGRILQKLDECQLTDKTLLLFLSDNGGNVHSNLPTDRKIASQNSQDGRLADWRKWAGDLPPTNNTPLREGKGKLYEGGIRVPMMAHWPGRIPAGTTDTIAGVIDIYPTILDLLDLRPAPTQIIDGVSLKPVLLGSGPVRREAYFTWFPHQDPGAVVRQGDWKLIRRYEPRPGTAADRHELYHLGEDLGETNNLAAKFPAKVAELDRLIDEFLQHTGAVTPQPNPAYDPAQPSPLPQSKSNHIQGLVPRACSAGIVDGVLRLSDIGPQAFLGTTQVKSGAPLELRIRLRAPAGGEGRIQWRLKSQVDFPATGQEVPYACQSSPAWQEISVLVPLSEPLGTLRLYLPQGNSTLDIDRLEAVEADDKTIIQRWNF